MSVNNNKQEGQNAKIEKDGAKINDRSSVPFAKVLDQIGSESGWKVKRKFQAPAAFLVPKEDGSNWNSTAGTNGGGNAVIEVHSKKGRKDVKIVRWLNFIGKDGLNCRIEHLLPLKRGKDVTEFFFKSSSATSFGIKRKTIFALKFEDPEDADEFEMWWFFLNGQITEWKNANGPGTASDNSTIVDDDDVLIRENVEFFTEKKFGIAGKRKFDDMRLKSPEASLQDTGFFSPGSKTPDPPKKKARIEELPEDDSESEGQKGSPGTDDSKEPDDEKGLVDTETSNVQKAESSDDIGDGASNEDGKDNEDNPGAKDEKDSPADLGSLITEKGETFDDSCDGSGDGEDDDEGQTVLVDYGYSAQSQQDLFFLRNKNLK